MIKITNPADCCGCTACASICSHNAITMKPDVLGFLYPEVDTTKCTDCGLCEKVCTFNDNYDKSRNFSEPITYGARHKDINEVMKSRSGAVFVVISDYILEHGGVVYGAGLTEQFRVVHKRATTKKQRDEFRGSKYVQSDLSNIFSMVKKDINEGRIVLFSGTPCQTSALKSYISDKRINQLILVDIICHGIASPKIWDDYLNYLSKMWKASIESVNFRDKNRFGWKSHLESYKLVGKEMPQTPPFGVYNDLYFRHSCYNCFYTNTRRPGDITIGDFWGVESALPGFISDDLGCNLVYINTQNGKRIFDKIKNTLIYREVDLVKTLQPNLQNPTSKNPNRDKFEKYYKKNGFVKSMRKFGSNAWRTPFQNFINSTIQKIKSIIK